VTGLGPRSKARRGRKRRAARWGKKQNGPRAWAGRGGLSWAKNRMKLIFLFLFQFFKTIFQKILKSILNLIQTTQYKISNAAA
jgi:hypothetical protein